MIYLVMFAISSFFFYLGDRYDKKGKLFWHVLGLIIPILMAGLRSEMVGIDIKTYVKPLYFCAKRSSTIQSFFIQMATIGSIKDLELGFSFLGYIVVKFTGNFQCLLGTYQMLMILMIYVSIKKYNEVITLKYALPKIQTGIAMFAYYTMFYNMSLTMIRQSIACSFVVYCIMCLLAQNYIRTIVGYILAILFHSTASIAVVIMLLYYIIKKNRKGIQWAFYIVGAIFAIMGGQMYWIVMNFLGKVISISSRYLSYEYMWKQGNGINWAFVYLIFAAFFSLWIIGFRKNKYNCFFTLEKNIVWFTVFLIPMSVAAANVSRVLYYFFYFFIFIFAMAANINVNVKIRAGYIVPVILCFGYFAGTVLFNDYTRTLEYNMFW